MITSEVTEAIEQFLKDNWTQTPIDFDNVKYTPESGQPWIRVQIDFPDARAVGTSKNRYFGTIMISVFTSLWIGGIQCADYLDQLETLFSEHALTIHSALQIFPARQQRVGVKDTNWYQRNLTIPVTVDYCKN